MLSVELTERELFLTKRGVKRLASETHHAALRQDRSELDRCLLAYLSGELSNLGDKLDRICKEECKK